MILFHIAKLSFPSYSKTNIKPTLHFDDFSRLSLAYHTISNPSTFHATGRIKITLTTCGG